MHQYSTEINVEGLYPIQYEYCTRTRGEAAPCLPPARTSWFYFLYFVAAELLMLV